MLKKAVNPFDAGTSYQELYELGAAALRSGRTREAAMLFRSAARKVPPSDTVWYERLKTFGRLSTEIKS